MSLTGQLELLRAGDAVVDRSDRGFVLVTGPDAFSFLQALVSADLDVVADLLVGPMFFRMLVSGAELTPELAAETVDLVLRGISPR